MKRLLMIAGLLACLMVPVLAQDWWTVYTSTQMTDVLRGAERYMADETAIDALLASVGVTSGVVNFSESVVQSLSLPLATAPSWTAGLYYAPAVTNHSAFIHGADQANASPLQVPRADTIDRLGAFVTTQGSANAVLRFCVYTDNGAGAPGTLIVDGGTVVATTGAKEVTVSASLPAGQVWVMVAAQGGAVTPPTLRGGFSGAPFSPIDTLAQMEYYTGASRLATMSGACPATYTTDGYSGWTPSVAVRVS